jgi:hypothetical protein
MEQIISNRDFSSISPSARWLLMLKGYTSIPFAREVAELLHSPDKYIPDFKRRDLTFWAVTYHFESRYWSINQLLKDLKVKNILELSSGYSFRSLEHARHEGIHYIDTDLPEIINTKSEFIKTLLRDRSDIKGKLELLPLNVLDIEGFHEIIGRFPPGEVAIVNEGLFTYLDREEQKRLCSVIHDILKERGGYWVNGDIYLKNRQPRFGFQFDDKIKRFNELHDTESNSFESFDEAEMFFRELGFLIDMEARIRVSELSSFKYLMKSITLRDLFKFRKIGKIQAAWRLKAI